MKPSEALALAMSLAKAGIPVFPIAISKNGAGTRKRPLTAHGHIDARTDDLRDFFLKARLGPREDLGVGAYPGPGGYVVLDIDVKEGGTGWTDLEALEREYGELPGNVTRVDTASGGAHFWFKRPKTGEQIPNSKPAPAIDVRGDNGWVVAPGTETLHGSWTRDESTPRIPDTATLPSQWKPAMTHPVRERTPIAETIRPGGRHATLLRVGGAMRRQGANEAEIYAALHMMNQGRFDPLNQKPKYGRWPRT